MYEMRCITYTHPYTYLRAHHRHAHNLYSGICPLNFVNQWLQNMATNLNYGGKTIMEK